MKHLKTHEGFKDWFKRKPKDVEEEKPETKKEDEKKPEVEKPIDPPTFDLLNDIMSKIKPGDSKIKPSDLPSAKSITKIEFDSKNEWMSRYRGKQYQDNQIYSIKVSDALRDRVVNEIGNPMLKTVDSIDLIMICELTDKKGVYDIDYTYLYSFKNTPENPIGYLSKEQEEFIASQMDSQMNESAAKRKTYRHWAANADFTTIGDNTIGIDPDNYITEYPQLSYSSKGVEVDLNDITKDNFLHRAGIDKIKHDISDRLTFNEVAYQTAQIGGIMNELDSQYKLSIRRKKMKDNIEDIKTIFYDISDIADCTVELGDDNTIHIYIKADGIEVIGQSKSGRTSSSYNRNWTANFNEANFKLTEKLMKIFELLQEAKPRIKDIIPDCIFNIKLSDGSMHININ